MSNKPRKPSYSAIQKDIGKRLLWARVLVEPNRAEFARDLGVDKSTVAKIESGARAPSVFNLLDFSQRLRVTPNYLLAGSMQGVDGEMAARLGALHPELANQPTFFPDIPGTGKAPDTDRRPKRRGPRR